MTYERHHELTKNSSTRWTALTSVALILAVGSAGCAKSTAHAESAHDETTAPEVATAAEDESAVAVPVTEPMPATAGPKLVVPLQSKSGSTVTGEVRLVETDEGVEIEVQIAHAKPGLHGVHIHQTADCSAADGSSAGGHYNPQDHPHGLPTQDERHLGDLGNISVEESGRGALQTTIPAATLEKEGDWSLIGRGIIVHADPDVGTQPSGNSGARVACGELVESAGEMDAAVAHED